MVIPRLNAKVTKRDLIRLRGFGLHETSHPRYQPDLWDVMKANPLPENHPLAAILNMVADVHAETSRAQEWEGDAKGLSEFGAVVGRDVTDRLREEIREAGGIAPESDFFKVAQIMMACVQAESSWNVGMRIGFAELQEKLMPEAIQIGRDEIESKFDLTATLTNVTCNASELWELSKKIYAHLWPDKDPEKEVQKHKKKKGESEEGEKSEESEESESSTPSKHGEDGDGTEKPTKPIPITVLVWSEHYDSKKRGASGQGFDYTDHKEYNVYTPVDFTEFTVVDYEKGDA
jgi:hypothetical protein